MAKAWDLRVDFNTYPGPDLVYGNARHAEPGVVVHEGAVLTLGDEDWGIVRAEIIDFDPATGTFTARLLGAVVTLDDGAASTTG